MTNHQLINADSGNYEYYTPPEILNRVRWVLGKIDLDPASSAVANNYVGASRIFTQEQGGLQQEWLGRVWMNHPFGRKTNKPWVDKLIQEYAAGRTTEALCITFASTSERWFAPLLGFPQCFLHGRLNYLLPDGSVKRGATKGSVITYLGEDLEKFYQGFKAMGTVKIPYTIFNK